MVKVKNIDGSDYDVSQPEVLFEAGDFYITTAKIRLTRPSGTEFMADGYKVWYQVTGQCEGEAKNYADALKIACTADQTVKEAQRYASNIVPVSKLEV